MKVEEKNWSKTLLSCYGHLETICGAIDKNVLNYGLKSSTMNCDVEFISSKMISLIERKKFLINIKVLVDSALKRMKDTEARVLILKYVDNIPSNLASEVMKISMRTYFRKVTTALDNFWTCIQHLGYSTKNLFSLFKDEKWILEIFESFNNKDKLNKKQKEFSTNIFSENTFSKKMESFCPHFVGANT